MSNTDTVKIRMYRHGFGDCFLLQFFNKGKRNFTMLIDCGLKLNDKGTGITMEMVRDDIAKQLKGRAGKGKPKLDVLVATHEHWDHVSAFHPDAGLFDGFAIDKLWLAWTENPEDPDGRMLNKGLAKRVKALQLAAEKLKKNTSSNTGFMLAQVKGNDLLQCRKDFDAGLDAVLGFFGPLGVKAASKTTVSGIRVKEVFKNSLQTQEAMDHLRELPARGNTSIRYFDPGELVENVAKLPGIRIFILGPPKSNLLNKAAPSSGAKKEVYLGDSSLTGFVEGLLGLADPGAAMDDRGKPFGNVVAFQNEEMRKLSYLGESYFLAGEEWRKIDHDWLDMAGALAMQMDTDTNNTSLVLAIEFIESGKVLLFPGDAQVGNWLSWHNYEWEVKKDGQKVSVNASNLLNNTVFYKVGHHSSHNATLKEKGLEMMTSEDLVAFVPEKQDQYSGIPFKPLLAKLRKKTKGRLLFSADKNYNPETVIKKKPAVLNAAEWKTFTDNIIIDKAFIEYTLNV